VAKRVARKAWPSSPTCWNWNASVIGGVNCRAPLDGSPLPLCLELGYTQNAYIVDCGGPWAGSEHCGTYLEIHRPGRWEKLGESRLVNLATSGYRMTVISTTYKKDSSKSLCYDPIKKGGYEVWWVLRAPDRFNVHKRIPFAVASPLCDWDPIRNRYLEYATLTTPSSSSTITDPYDPSRRLYTQPRVQAKVLSRPAPGMGSTIVFNTTSDLSFPESAVFDRVRFGDNFTYSWRPTTTKYSTASGALSPSLEEQTFIAQERQIHGYRRVLREAPALQDGPTGSALGPFLPGPGAGAGFEVRGGD